MILADKIITLRKKNGWSQEELAEKMNVSRQSVSKWEGAQSVPDLNKILLLGQIFGVSTDYLLKDDMEEIESEYLETGDTEILEARRKVSMEEAHEFLTIKAETAGKTALAVFMCILSPVCLLLLAAGQECGIFPISEDAAAGLGMIILLFIVAAAVAIFISVGMKTSQFEYLEKEIIETEYGVDGMVREKQKQYKDTYVKYNIIGTCLCILSLVPLFATILFTENDFIITLMLCVLLLMIAVGVVFFVVAGIRWGSMQRLLQEGDYSVAKKKTSSRNDAIATIYWLTVTAIFLGYGFVTYDWSGIALIWPIAAILFGALLAVCKLVWKEE